MDLFKKLLNRTKETEEAEEWPKERTETKTVNIVKNFTNYKVSIEYSDGKTQTEYVTKYNDVGDTLHLYDGTPQFDTHCKLGSTYRNTPTRDMPIMKIRDGDPTIISYANVNSVDIEEYDKLVAVVEDVAVDVIYRQHEPDGEWEEAYQRFEQDDERDYNEEITEWLRYEWTAHNS